MNDACKMVVYCILCAVCVSYSKLGVFCVHCTQVMCKLDKTWNPRVSTAIEFDSPEEGLLLGEAKASYLHFWMQPNS